NNRRVASRILGPSLGTTSMAKSPSKCSIVRLTMPLSSTSTASRQPRSVNSLYTGSSSAGMRAITSTRRPSGRMYCTAGTSIIVVIRHPPSRCPEAGLSPSALVAPLVTQVGASLRPVDALNRESVLHQRRLLNVARRLGSGVHLGDVIDRVLGLHGVIDVLVLLAVVGLVDDRLVGLDGGLHLDGQDAVPGQQVLQHRLGCHRVEVGFPRRLVTVVVLVTPLFVLDNKLY